MTLLMDYLSAMPDWLDYLVRGIVLALLLAFSAVIAARVGRNPYWALLVIVPPFLLVGIWVLAFTRWPRVDALATKR